MTLCVNAFGQNSIAFANITIKAATQRANIENKNIFVDAYAPWCGPCKMMDMHFKDKEVIKYFNRNFINVKIDTDTKYGKILSAKYGIAFLPTILILDKDGVRRFKVDKLISRDELLSLAHYAIDGPKQVIPSPPSTPDIAINTSAKPKETSPTKKEVVAVVKKDKKPKASPAVEESNETILYVLDANATDLPPEILYEESYFRMQLNDGSHKETAAKYLATQEDWLTEKNLKFIFDFLYDTDSKEFDFFISNKGSFAQYIGEEKMSQSLKILIENKLYQGIPRPTFEQSEYLLSLIDSENATKNNYHYFLNRLYTEEKESKFFDLADKYFKIFDQTNQGITVNYVSQKLTKTTQKNKVKTLASILSKIEAPEENFNYFLCKAKIHLALSDKTNAIDFANKAISQAKEEGLNAVEAKQILETVKEL